VGSLAVKLDSNDKVANRSFLLDAVGNIVASYDKIHMFDVQLPSGETYRESATFKPGETAVVAPTPWGQLGMSVCYDVRFAVLYRALAQAGASILTVPAAFTRTTGKAHWHILLRARAIETGCFVVAAAQCGTHAEGRQTFGHSLIVDPWGEVLADGGEEVGVTLARIDTARVAEVRGMVPALSHDRVFSPPKVLA
jgi:predicted amidohydrolase